MCKTRFGSQGVILDGLKQKSEKTLMALKNLPPPSSWQMPIEISDKKPRTKAIRTIFIYIDNHLVERAKFGCSVAVAFHHRGDAVGIADKMKIFQNIFFIISKYMYDCIYALNIAEQFKFFF